MNLLGLGIVSFIGRLSSLWWALYKHAHRRTNINAKVQTLQKCLLSQNARCSGLLKEGSDWSVAFHITSP